VLKSKQIVNVDADVSHPPHYTSLNTKCEKCRHPIECKTIYEQFPGNLAAAIKYIWRADFKGNVIKDLKKAIKYLCFEIEKREREKNETDNSKG
jgi:hypothetical protein